MTFEHARRYLFRLYASSKEHDRRGAGCFGVGFWSVLRFEPTRLIVRSWPREAAPWEVELDGTLSHALRRTPATRPGTGTEVVLEREGPTDGQLERRVADAARQSARFLTRRDRSGRPLEILVNGRPINEPFALPAPSASFGGRGERGVVGLGPSPRVELFSKGLRLRAASEIDDLLAPLGPTAAFTRLRFEELAEGLAPVALLECDALEPLLARGDVRENRALRRLVGCARSELQRLVACQLEALRPRRWWRRLFDSARAAFGASALLILIAACALALGLVGGAWWWSRYGDARGDIPRPRPSAAAPPAPFRDLAASYRGPSVVGLAQPWPLALTYAPPERSPAFVAFVVLDLDHPQPAPLDPRRLSAYTAPSCAAGCLAVQLDLVGVGATRLPVATGERIDPASLRLDDRPTALWASADDEPVMMLGDGRERRARVSYRSGPAPAPRLTPGARAPVVPAEVTEATRALSGLTEAERVLRAVAWVRARVAFSSSPAVAHRHAAAIATGRPFAARALEIGAGDCDVVNGLLLLLLRELGLEARLAVGWVGAHGAALGPHAWVEYRPPGVGAWRVADATGSSTLAADARDHREDRDASALARGAPPATSPTPFTEAAPARRLVVAGSVVPFCAVLALLALGAVLTTAVVVLRRRGRVSLAPAGDVAALLRGALQRPDAFGADSAIFSRALVPTLRRPISLREAWGLVARGRLYVTHEKPPLARAASRRGAVVLDGRSPESATVAAALGAVDLDAWAARLGAARSSRLLGAVAVALRNAGERLRIASTAVAAAPELLDLPRPWPLGQRTERCLLIEDDAPLRSLERLYERRPAEAVFSLAERLSLVLGIGGARRAQVLSELAWRAIGEAHSAALEAQAR